MKKDLIQKRDGRDIGASPMKKTKIKIKHFLLLLGLIYFIVLPMIDYFCLKINGKCTVGVVDDVKSAGKSAKNSVYRYSVNGKIYTNECAKSRSEYLYQKFVVLYDETNPYRSVLYHEYPQEGNFGDQLGECKKDNLFIKIYLSGGNFYDIYLKSH